MEGFVRILRFCLAAFVLLAFALWVTLQLSPVQTEIARKALDTAREKIDGDVSIGSIHIKPFNTVVLKDLCIVDRMPATAQARDTLIYAEAMMVRVDPIRLIVTRKFALKNLRLKNATLNLVREPSEWRMNLKRIFRSPVKHTPSDMPHREIIRINDIFIENFTFRLQNFVKEQSSTAEDVVNWRDLDVRNIDLHAENFSINDGIFHGEVDRFSFREVSGLQITSLSGKADVGRGHTVIKDCVLNIPGTEVAMDLTMEGYKMDFRKFATNVDMDIDIKSSRISLETLHSFIGAVNPDPNVFLSLEGGISGKICDLHFDNLTAKAEKYCAGLSITGDLTGLGQASGLWIDSRIDNFFFTPGDLRGFLGKMLPKVRLNLGKTSLKEYYRGNLVARGNMDRMNIGLLLKQGRQERSAKADLTVTGLGGGKRTEIGGSVSCNMLDLEVLAGISVVSDISASALLSARLPRAQESLEATLDSLKISNLKFKGHNYKNIFGQASIMDKDITGDIKCRDDALDADVTAWSDKYSYNANVNIAKADLVAMNFSKKEKFIAGMNIYGRTERELSKINGNVDISNLFLDTSDGEARTPTITFGVEQLESGWDITMDSEQVRGNLSGNRQDFNAELDILGINPFLQCVIPGLYVERNSRVAASASDGVIHCSFVTGRLAYYDKFLKNLSIKVDGDRHDMDADISSESLCWNGAIFNNPTLIGHMKDSLVSFSVNYGDLYGKPVSGHLAGEAIVLAKNDIGISLSPSVFYTPVHTWKGGPCTLRLTEGSIEIRDMFLDGGKDRWIRADGRISPHSKDTLGFDIRNFNLAAISSFVKQKDLVPSGYLNARGRLISPGESPIPGILVGISTDSLKMGNDFLGNLTITGRHARNTRMLSVRIEDELLGNKLIRGTAEYDFADKSLGAKIRFRDFPLHFIQSYVNGAIGDLDGYIDGDFNIGGPVKDLHVDKCDFSVRDGKATILYTNVPYTFDGRISMGTKSIRVDKILFKDKNGGSGTLRGNVDWENLSDPEFDIVANLRSLQLLQSSKNPAGKGVWGDLAISGEASCKGPMSKLAIDADIRSTGISNIHVVMPDRIDASTSSLLTFINTPKRYVDPYDDMLKRNKQEKEAAKMNVTLNARATLDPSLSFGIDMGSGGFAAGISGSGSGVINLKGGTGKDLAVLGDYTIQEGSFGINTGGLVQRNFQVKNGSSIQFRGSLPESILDLNAAYETKASIATLIADTSSVSNRRQIFCGIAIKDKLSNPQMKFSIDIPDLEPSVKSRVESALSTEDKIQKQFLSLLLSNSFLPDEQNSIVNNSAFLYSNVSEMVANQVNNIFTRLDIPLDLGLNYQPGKSGASLFDVAISTQLFNNRVIIGGTFGNRENKSTGNGQSFFGDIDIQYKVNRTGTLRLKAFSHSADQYSNSLDNSQRNGIGITWQQEFDRFCTWCQELFMSREKKMENSARKLEAEKQKRTIILSE